MASQRMQYLQEVEHRALELADELQDAKERISALKEENQKLKAQLSQIDDWVWNDRDKGISAEIFWRVHSLINSDEAESGTPYGCKCKTLHHRVTGDGCHICNPPESGEKGEE